MTITSTGVLFSNRTGGANVPPDSALSSVGEPADNFVLCRDISGVPTAVYGEDVWDFNPYRLSARKLRLITFESIALGCPNRQGLVREVKQVLFLIIYSVSSGRLGKLSAISIVNYFMGLRTIANFCAQQSAKPLVGALSLQQLFTTRAYLSALLLEQGHSARFKSTLSALLRYLANIGESKLGYKVVQRKDIKVARSISEQHVVIPPRIYIGFINSLGDMLERLRGCDKQLEKFIGCFSDEYYARSHLKQKQMGVGGRQFHRPLFSEGAIAHGLEDVLVGDFFCHNRKDLPRAIASIQYVLKNVIHLYTGMRDQEVCRLQYDCILSEKSGTIQSVDEIESDLDPVVYLISTTTKFEGYRKQESWLATEEVKRAVIVAQSICRALAKYHGVAAENCPLFLSPSILTNSKAAIEVRENFGKINTAWVDGAVINQQDFLELTATDPGRNFSVSGKYCVGQPWPLSSHQFRRSLAFYASNSGFVSLPTIRTQFKHLTLQMAKYYRNGFGNLRTIFGYYNPQTGKFQLPQSHVALEFQMGVPVSVANLLIGDLLSDETPLFGGTGAFMEKQKKRLDSDSVSIVDVKNDTLRRAQKGELSYRPTVLGGCTKVGRCDSFMLGDVAACLACEDAIIKPEKLQEVIIASSRELEGYRTDSGEYQVVKKEVERLAAFSDRFRRVVGVI